MPEPIITGLLTAALFRAVEKIWEESAKAAWTPGTDAIRARVLRWTGKNKESQRRAAFGKAAPVARANTLKHAGDPDTARKVLDLLDGKIDKRAAEVLAEEGAKLLLFADQPDLDRLTRVYQRTVGFEAIMSGEETLPAATIAPVLADYLDNLREALLDQEAYADLIQKDMRSVLREILAELRPVDYDDESVYRQQMAEMHSRLDFVGIPELKERRPITVEDIFIKLRVKRKSVGDVRYRTWNTSVEELGLSSQSLSTLQGAGISKVGEILERLELSDQEMLAVRGFGEQSLSELKQRLAARGEEIGGFATFQSVPEALQQGERLIILGEPGAGKTTLLKYLAVICAEGRAEAELGLTAEDGGSPLPVFIPLREFAAACATREGDYCLLDYLYTHAREHLMLNPPRNFFEEALAAGRCLVCLDGLDEVWAVDRRKVITDAVRALASRYRDNRYLVTSRIVGYEEAPLGSRDFVHYTILPLEDADIEEFVRKWYTAREHDAVHRDERIKDLLDTLKREPRISDLARNPLLLTIIALVHRIEAELPHERVKLYDKCVTALVDTWDEVKGLSITEKQRPFYRERRRLLERLSYELHSGTEGPGQLRTIKVGNLELLLARFLMENRRLGYADDRDAAREEATAFVRLARGRTGLLVERGEGIFGFPHLTFQEYLAACDIEHRCMAYGVEAVWHEIAVKHSLHDPHWREVILLLLGSLNRYEDAPTLLVERILHAGETDPFEPVLHRHLYLTTYALADRVEVAAVLRRRIVDAAITIAREGPRWEARDAILSLSYLITIPYATDQLLVLAHDAQVNDWVRCDAALALILLDWADEATVVLLALARDAQIDADVRIIAALMLSPLTWVNETTTVLLTLACDAQVNAEVRRNAAKALGELGRADQAATVFLALARDAQVDAGVRCDVATALGQLGRGDEAAPILLALAQDAQADTHVRIDAAKALGQLGRGDETATILLALVQDAQADLVIQSSALQALGQLGRAGEATPAGLSALTHDAQARVWTRCKAIEALGQLGQADEATHTGLLALANDAQVSVWIRSAAAQALVQLGRADEAAISLLALARDAQVNDYIRCIAAQTLSQLGWVAEAIFVLLALARDIRVDAGVRCIAAQALNQLGRVDEAMSVLLALARDVPVDAWDRSVLALALAQLDRVDEARAILLALAHDAEADAYARYIAAQTLGYLGPADEATLTGLLALASDVRLDEKVRRAAYDSLKQFLAA